jgi:hypothetical protein
MTVAQARRALGGRLKVDPGVNGCEFLRLPGGSEGVAPSGRTVTIIFVGARVRTTKGIRAGSSLAAARAAYGRQLVPAPAHNDLSGVTEFWWIRRGPNVLEFGIRNGKVASMILGRQQIVLTFGECA